MDDQESGEVSAGIGAAVSVGSAAAQGGMNPMADISAAISLVGLGTSIFGAKKSSDATGEMAKVATNEANANVQVSKLEMSINDQRQQQSHLDTNRQQLQVIRNTQLARSMALNSSVGQGANMGSGLQGGFGQISGDSNTSMLGLSQNREIGDNIFAFNDQISQQKQLLAQYAGQMAVLQGKASKGAGISSIGGAITKSADPMGKLMGGFGSSSPKQGVTPGSDAATAQTSMMDM